MSGQASHLPAYDVGRRVRLHLQDGKTGTIVKVRLPAGMQSVVSYDIAWDGGGGVERVAQNLLQGPSWDVLPQVWPADRVQAVYRAWLEERLRARSAQAVQRMQAARSFGVSHGATFYRPSEVHVHDRTQARQAASLVASEQIRGEATQAAKTIRTELATTYPGVRFHVSTKGDKVSVSWVDGPVTVRGVTDRFLFGRYRHPADYDLPHAGQIATRRDISDAMIEAATEYVRRVTGEPLPWASCEAFRNGALRDRYPSGSRLYSSLSIGQLIRVVLLRWDDFERCFVAEGPTRAMVLENEALFPSGDLARASALMREIRAVGSVTTEVNAQSNVHEVAKDLWERE